MGIGIPPIPGQGLLLHVCCAPCAGAIVEFLCENRCKPVLFFSNSNIDTEQEFNKRLSEVRRYASFYGLEVVCDPYDHSAWLEAVRGLENEPERGRRCSACFLYRLQRSAAFAAERGLKAVTTTLASSRWKSLQMVDEAGRQACREVEWWGRNWRKDGLQERRSAIIRQWEFYNQTYCGCEFSRHER